MSDKVIELLNNARSRELTAIMQYMGQHYELADAGYGKLGATIRATAIVEMRHAERLAERILFLNGVPDSAPMTPEPTDGTGAATTAACPVGAAMIFLLAGVGLVRTRSKLRD